MMADVICQKQTQASIAEISHDALWSEVEIGCDIPIGAAAVIPGDATLEDIQWAEKVFQGAENAFAK